jgi:hypothetical protein
MVNQNSKKSNAKKITFKIFIWCDVRVYLCQKYICHNILKNENIIQKMIEIIFSFYDICTIY